MFYKENILTVNKKIYHDYYIKCKYVAGIVLEGWEVKGIKNFKFQIINSYAIINKNEVFLLGMLVNELQNNKKRDSLRTKKLLLNKNEIKKIEMLKKKNKISIVPLKCFIRNNIIKLEIAIVEGKKKSDKRNILKENDWKKKRQHLLKIKNRG